MSKSKEKQIPFSVADEATPEQKAAVSRYVQKLFKHDEDTQGQLLEMLGLRPYERLITTNHGNRTRVVMSE